jgi:hypothetical protein
LVTNISLLFSIMLHIHFQNTIAPKNWFVAPLAAVDSLALTPKTWAEGRAGAPEARSGAHPRLFQDF